MLEHAQDHNVADGLDRDWLFESLERRGQSLRKLAAYMGLDPSAVSRLVSGERGMKATEQDQIAAFLGIAAAEVASHRTASTPPGAANEGFGEMKQAAFKPEGAGDGKEKKPYRHPAWGALKGMITIAPGVDLTAPAFDNWKALYGEGE